MFHANCLHRLGPLLLASVAGGALPAVAVPAISTQPASVAVAVGQPAVFSVAATDSAPLFYQWWRGAEAIIDATGTTYTVPAATLADGGAVFRVTVSSENGTSSSVPVTLTVNPAAPVPFATWALAIPDSSKRGALDVPADDGVPNLLKYALGLTPTVRATPAQLPQLGAEGANALYRFSHDKAATGIVATAQTSTTLDAASWTAASGGTKVSDDGRTEVWEAPLAAGPRRFARLAVTAQSPAEPVPTLSGPQGVTVAAGQAATFNVAPGGVGPYTYQWRRNGRDIRGATTASYTFPVAMSADDGARFSVVVAGAAGTVSSADAVLTVTPAGNGTVLYTRDRLHSPIDGGIADRLKAVAPSGTTLRGNVFMKIGDSITAGDGLLGTFGTGNIEGDGPSWEFNILFGSRPDLKPLVQFFRTGLVPAGGTETCLERASLAARVGMAAGWATEGNPSPLQQEYVVAQPRYAVIMYGSNDIGWYQGGPYGHVYQLTNYQVNMLRIVDECLARGVIPILTTMPPHAGYLPQVPYYVEMVRSLAQGRRVPLIDHNQAMMAIGPAYNFGLGSDGVHPTSPGYNGAAWLDAESLHCGVNTRNLLTLDALARVKALIVDGAAAPDPVVSRLPGTGTPADPFLMPSVPFADFRNTQDSSSSSLNGYAGATVSTPGPEYVYRLVVPRPMQLRLLAIDKGANAVRLHVLGATVSPAGCLASDDAMILRDFTPGTYHLVVDSRTATGGEFSLLVLDNEEVPTAVTNLTGTVTPAGAVSLTWNAATSNDPITRYALFRGEDSQWGPSFDTSPFAIVDGATLSWIDTGCVPASVNFYRVMAIDANGDAGLPCEGVPVTVP